MMKKLNGKIAAISVALLVTVAGGTARAQLALVGATSLPVTTILMFTVNDLKQQTFDEVNADAAAFIANGGKNPTPLLKAVLNNVHLEISKSDPKHEHSVSDLDLAKEVLRQTAKNQSTPE